MKNGKRILQLRVEAEAAEQRKRAENVKMEIPEDAKRPEELLEELLDHFPDGKKDILLRENKKNFVNL